MKLKLNLDKKTILDFLIQNAEKIVFGLIVIVMLLMLYAAFTGAKRYERSPKQLEEAVRRGEDEIKATPADSVGLAVTPYAKQAKESRVDIEEEPYAHANLWDKPLFDRRPLRDTPPLFAVQQLRGASGIGAFRAAPERAAAKPVAKPGARPGTRPAAGAAAPVGNAAGSSLVGQRWIVVTGLVPIKEQTAAYLQSFRQSVFFDSQRDIPDYSDYLVERVELNNAAEAANPDWTKAKKFTSRDAKTAVDSWASAGGKELVADKYLESKLVFPLGPLVNQQWTADVAHEPEIPVKKSTDRDTGMGDRGERGIRPEAGLDVRGDRGDPLGGEGRGVRRGEQSDDDSPFADRAKDDKTTRKPDDKVADDVDTAKKPAFKLFRFFDFTVEPGKQYVYRVRLALYNPNRHLKTSLLKNPELADLGHLLTKWSDPTAAISVARDTRILAMSVQPARSSIDSTATILVTKWLKTKGIEAFLEKSKVGRGQLCDFPRERFKPPKSARADGARAEVTVDFITDATLIDLHGGERLGKKSTSPGEILVLDSNGNLFVRDELDDSPLVDELTNAKAEAGADDMRGVGPMDRGMPMPGGLDAFPGADERRPRR